MYIEHTPQGFNIMGVSPALLEEIIRALHFNWSEKTPEVQAFIDKSEKELNNNL